MTETLIHFPIYIGDYLKNTMSFTQEERGAYMDICIAYIQNDGVLKDDETLYILTRCFTEQNRTSVATVVERAFKRENGRIISDTLNGLILKQKSLRTQRIEAGKKSAQKRAKIQRAFQQSESESESESDTELESLNSFVIQESRSQEILNQFDIFWQDFPTNGRNKGSKKDAEAKFKIALKKSTFNEIMDGVNNYATYIATSGQSNQDAFRWLEKERWKDDYTIANRIDVGKSTADDNCTAGIILALREHAEQNGY